jgi:3-methyladenine DNA glycosylase AlkD
MKKFKAKLLQQLLQHKETEKPSGFKDLKKYIGTDYEFVGLSVPGQRTLFKKGFSFSDHDPQSQLDIWDKLWKESRQYEIMNFALMFISKHVDYFSPAILWNITKSWVEQVDNWAHSDSLSGIYAQLLEKETDLIYTHYKNWNTSPNPWERRQSIVGLLYYSRMRKAWLPLDKMLAMVSPLMHDEDYFVQKGVGWTLREMGNVYPEKVYTFLETNITVIHPVAFTAAIEKLDDTIKAQLKALRKPKKKKQS